MLNNTNQTNRKIPPCPSGLIRSKSLDDFVKEQDLRALIGKNQDYYLRKWKHIFKKTGKISSIKKSWSFNLASSFFPGIWFIYRGMYVHGAVFLILLSGSAVLSDATIGIPSLIGNIVNFMLLVYVSFRANGLYFSFLAKKIRTYHRQQKEFPLYTNHIISAAVVTALFLTVSYLSSTYIAKEQQKMFFPDLFSEVK